MIKLKWPDQLSCLIEKFEIYIFLGLLALLLWPIWANKYFLTLDGPSHVYNASVLLDYWRGIGTDFFSKFYVVNRQVDPNWFSHVVLAVLMRFMPAILSEKIFITAYVLCFLIFSRALILHINKPNKLLSLIPFLFVYHYVFQKGFYNFSFSLAWMILAWWFFLKFINRWKIYLFLPVGSFILLITYFAHPVGYLLACSALILILFLDTLQNQPSWRNFIRQFARQLLVVLIAMLPSLVLLCYFIIRRSSIPTVANDENFTSMGNRLIHLTAIINLVSGEAPFAQATFIFIAAVMAVALIIKALSLKFDRFDGFLILIIFLVILYFKSPYAIAGAGIVKERFQILPFVVLPFWLASVKFPKWLAAVNGIVSLILVICLMAVRIPVHKLCSGTVAEYLTVGKFIKSESTVLPLSYAHGGKTPDGKIITDRHGIFYHAAEYLGTEKPLVLMGNYEGNTGYFPILWKDNVNPFIHLCSNEGIEGIPPSVDLEKYTRETSFMIDYVILLSLDDEYLKRPNTINLLSQLEANYNKIYVSEHQEAIIYERKDMKK